MKTVRPYHVSGDDPPATWRWEFAWESTGTTVQLEDNRFFGSINGTALRQTCFLFIGDKKAMQKEEG